MKELDAKQSITVGQSEKAAHLDVDTKKPCFPNT